MGFASRWVNSFDVEVKRSYSFALTGVATAFYTLTAIAVALLGTYTQEDPLYVSL